MRLLIVCDSMAAGGTEILTANLANKLKAKGVDVSLFILPIPDAIDFSALNILDKSINRWVFARKNKMDFTIFGAIREKYKDCRPDAVMCQALFSFYCFSLATMFLKKPKTYLVLHYTRNVKLKDEFFDWFYFSFIRFLRVEFIAIYKNQIDLFANKYRLKKDKFHLIHNGVDLNHFSPVQQKIKVEIFRILHIANMRKEKDEKTLIRSLGIFDGQCKNWHAVLCGRDLIGIKATLVGVLKESNIENNVRFIDYEADVRNLLLEADVFVLTSMSEALPMVALEAMAMGVPCILTNVGGCADIIDDGENGFLVPPKNAAAIAEKLAFLVKHRDVFHEMGMGARKKVENRFGIDLMVNSYLKLFY